MIRKPSLKRQNDKVMICAYGESMNRTPWEDTSFDCFMLNAAHRFNRPDGHGSLASYASLWFQMHRPGSGDGHIDDPDHQKWLATWQGCPIFMIEKYDWVPQAVEFPIDAVTMDCGPGRHLYTTSIDFMLAYAIAQEYKEIHLYGVDLINEWYQDKRHSIGYYLGLAAGRGIEIYVPKEANLLRWSHVYGYEKPHSDARMLAHIDDAIGETRKDQGKLNDKLIETYGAIGEQQGMRRAYENIAKLLRLRDNGSTI